MATLNDRTYSQDLVGLGENAAFALGLFALSTLAYELIRRKQRRTRYTVRGGKRDGEGETMEDLSFGYLYHARCFIGRFPAPRLSRWPFGWVRQTCWLDDQYYAEHSGLDFAIYIRFLRACAYFTLSQTLTTFPVLTAIDVVFAPADPNISQIARASLTSLVATDKGKSLLWVQTVMIWWISLCWFAALIWVVYGAVRLRRTHLRALLTRVVEDELSPVHECEGAPVHDADRGWRFRTVLMRNIPLSSGLRDERRLIEYFEQRLGHRQPISPRPSTSTAVDTSVGPPSPNEKAGSQAPFITNVSIIRRNIELQAQVKKRNAALEQLERNHVLLARAVLNAVERHVQQRDAAPAPTGSSENLAPALGTEQAPLDRLADALSPYLDSAVAVVSETTVWEVLRTLPKELLEPYQPMHKLSHLFRGQLVPAIDYWLAKVNLLTALVDDLRGRPDEYPASAIAFITFARAVDARRAVRMSPGRYVNSVQMAPDARDLIWHKLARNNFTADALKSIITTVLITFFTLIWLLPLSLALGLFSFKFIAEHFPTFAAWLNDHTKAKSLLTTTLPTILVSVISFVVPTLLNQITMAAQNIFMTSRLHDTIMRRYCSVRRHLRRALLVVFFCLGTALIQLFFSDPLKLVDVNGTLTRVAGAFPTGATFFVSWQVIQMGFQISLEQSLIDHISTVKALSPRKRLETAEPRNLNIYWYLPTHLLLLGVGQVFAVLNPIVIAFNMLYFVLLLTLFKHQFTHVYYRRFYECRGRFLIRAIRFSLDMTLLAQVVLMARPGSGGAVIALIVVTAGFKLVMTRWYALQSDALDISEASIVCGAEIDDHTQDRVHVPILPGPLRHIGLFKRFVISLPALRLGTGNDVEAARATYEMQRRHEKVASEQSQQGSGEKSNYPPQSGVTAAASTPSKVRNQDVEGAVSPRRSSGIVRPPSMARLVTPHPPTVRDDSPNPSEHYDDPAVVEPLCRYLWLPRDPRLDIDLNDTVEYRGECLVSSAGGDGQLGAWPELSPISAPSLQPSPEPIQPHEETHGLQVPPSPMPSPGLQRVKTDLSHAGLSHRPSNLSARSGSILPESSVRNAIMDGGLRLRGTERIRVAAEVAIAAGRMRGNSASSAGSGGGRPRGDSMVTPPATADGLPGQSASLSVPMASPSPDARHRRFVSSPSPARSPSSSRFGFTSAHPRAASAFAQHPPSISEAGEEVLDGGEDGPHVSQAEALHAEVMAEERQAMSQHERDVDAHHRGELERERRLTRIRSFFSPSSSRVRTAKDDAQPDVPPAEQPDSPTVA